MYVADILMDDLANIVVYDPKVNPEQMFTNIDYLNSRSEQQNREQLKPVNNPYSACKNAHAVAVLTEWDEFKDYDWQRIYDNMMKPAFVFDGRNILDRAKLESIGFKYFGIGR
jgi:UDPglucose 6-dehydrogenase